MYEIRGVPFKAFDAAAAVHQAREYFHDAKLTETSIISSWPIALAEAAKQQPTAEELFGAVSLDNVPDIFGGTMPTGDRK